MMFPVVMSFSPDIRRPFLAAFTGKRILARHCYFFSRFGVADMNLKEFTFKAVKGRGTRCTLFFVGEERSFETVVFLPGVIAKNYTLAFPDLKEDKQGIINPVVWADQEEESPRGKDHRLRYFIAKHSTFWLLVKMLYVGADGVLCRRNAKIRLPWEQLVDRTYFWFYKLP